MNNFKLKIQNSQLNNKVRNKRNNNKIMKKNMLKIEKNIKKVMVEWIINFKIIIQLKMIHSINNNKIWVKDNKIIKDKDKDKKVQVKVYIH